MIVMITKIIHGDGSTICSFSFKGIPNVSFAEGKTTALWKREQKLFLQEGNVNYFFKKGTTIVSLGSEQQLFLGEGSIDYALRKK